MCSDPVVVPVESEEEKGEHSDPEKEEDIGITFVARKAETPKQRPKSGESPQLLRDAALSQPDDEDHEVRLKAAVVVVFMFLSPPSVPAALDGCPSPAAVPPSPPSGDCHLPWKGSMGSPPPCVSVEATKIIPVDLQQAWNQSISSLESISSPPAPAEPVHPRVSALSRLGGPRPASYSLPGSVATSTSSIGAQVSQGSFRFPEKKKKEEEEEEEEASQEMKPLMSSLRPPSSLPPPPPSPAPGSGRRRNPCVYLRSLVTAPPPGSSEPQSRGPTQL